MKFTLGEIEGDSLPFRNFSEGGWSGFLGGSANPSGLMLLDDIIAKVWYALYHPQMEYTDSSYDVCGCRRLGSLALWG